jgi:hypothetical protein
VIRFDISLRIWAYACRERVWDPDFNTADLTDAANLLVSDDHALHKAFSEACVVCRHPTTQTGTD